MNGFAGIFFFFLDVSVRPEYLNRKNTIRSYVDDLIEQLQRNVMYRVDSWTNKNATDD